MEERNMYLYNSLTHKKELFVPNDPNLVKMYTCGPTVYHYAHIGNLRTYIMEDVLEKSLRYLGYNVKRVIWLPMPTPARTRCSKAPGGNTRPSWRSRNTTPTPFLPTATS